MPAKFIEIKRTESLLDFEIKKSLARFWELAECMLDFENWLKAY